MENYRQSEWSDNSNEESPSFHRLKSTSQNVRGMKDSLKLENVIDQMMQHRIDAFFIQKKWLKGDLIKVVI